MIVVIVVLQAFLFFKCPVHLSTVLLLLAFRLDGSVDRFRKLDMSIGEREMKIAELEAQYVIVSLRPFAMCPHTIPFPLTFP